MKGKNIGEIIQKVAVIFGLVTVIGCFIAAIAFYEQAGNSYYQKDFYYLMGTILMFGGTITGALFALLMYGFGELILHAKTIADNTAEDVSLSTQNISEELPEI